MHRMQLMYAQNAIAVNEFLGQSWNKVVNATSNETLGVHILKVKGMFVDPNWYWIGVAALLGYIFMFNILFVFLLNLLDPLGKSHTVTSVEDLEEKHAYRIKEIHLVHVESDPEKRDVTWSGQNGSDTKNRKRGMVLPFTPLWITFDKVSYAINMSHEIKEMGVVEERLLLLKGVSGAFRPGVLTALMGVIGAGKTTLMDVLSRRETGGYLKVYESLVYSTWLRLPADIDEATRKMFVEEVRELVELTSLRGALVGLPGVNGLATEQQKRLTNVVELVANPSIMFMDEPTSGLDARAAAIVMRTIMNSVDTGRTVLCTIHQPSIDIFEAFDELFLMRRGGEEIYVGPLGCNSCDLINYFEDIQGVRKISDGYNPASWMLEVASQAQEDIMGIDFADIYTKFLICTIIYFIIYSQYQLCEL